MVVSADTLIGLTKRASKRQLIKMMVLFFIIDLQNSVERNLAVYDKYEIKLKWCMDWNNEIVQLKYRSNYQ
jgi:hypothetical protein